MQVKKHPGFCSSAELLERILDGGIVLDGVALLNMGELDLSARENEIVLHSVTVHDFNLVV